MLPKLDDFELLSKSIPNTLQSLFNQGRVENDMGNGWDIPFSGDLVKKEAINDA